MLLVSQESRLWAIRKSIIFDSHKEAWSDPHGNHDRNGNGSLYCILELIVGHRRPWTTDVMSSMGPMVSRWWHWMPAKVCKWMSLNKCDLLSCIDKNQSQRNHIWDLACILSWSCLCQVQCGVWYAGFLSGREMGVAPGHPDWTG